MRTITVLNRKGGVGKTSVTVNLAAALAAAGYPTLVADLDAQGDTLVDFGARDRSDGGLALAQAAMAGTAPTPVKDVRPNLDVVPGGPRLEDLSAVLTSRRLRSQADPLAAQDLLTQSLRAAAAGYSFTIIDSPPGGSVLQEAALAASQWVLVPTGPDEASISALEPLAELFMAARERNPELQLLGVFLFRVGATSRRVIRQAATTLVEIFEGLDVVMTAPVRLDDPESPRSWLTIRDVGAVAVECRRQGVLVHELEKSMTKPTGAVSGLAEDYEKLSREVVARIRASENPVIDVTETAEVSV